MARIDPFQKKELGKITLAKMLNYNGNYLKQSIGR